MNVKRLVDWSCLWGGGVAWGLHLVAAWLIAEFGCVGGSRDTSGDGVSPVAWAVFGTTAVCLGLAGWATWSSWRRTRGGAAGSGFIGRTGLILNPLFAMVILAQTVPVFFYLKDCGGHLQ